MLSAPMNSAATSTIKLTLYVNLLKVHHEPVFSVIPPGCNLFERFATISSDDVTALIRRLPDKQSFCDVLPVPVLKQVTAEISSFLTSLYNRLMSTGVFPDRYKMAYITLIIKKPGWLQMTLVRIDLYRICLLHQKY